MIDIGLILAVIGLSLAAYVCWMIHKTYKRDQAAWDEELRILNDYRKALVEMEEIRCILEEHEKMVAAIEESNPRFKKAKEIISKMED